MHLAATATLIHQQGVATRRQLLTAGMTPAALRTAVAGGSLARVGHGLYRDRPPPARGRHLLSGGAVDAGYAAEVREALLRLGDGARAARLCAAVVWGMDLQVEPEMVDVDVPRGRRAPSIPGVQARESRRGASRLWVPVPGTAAIAVTPPVQTVLDCAAALPLAQAVVVADSALRRRLVTLPDLRAGVSARTGVCDAAHLRQVLRWCDARSGSVLESILRALLCLHGLAPERTQHVLTDPVTGRARRVDLAWPERKLVVECDGRRWHDPADRRDEDRRRDNTCAGLGWRVLRFTWAEVVHDPDTVVATVRLALAA
jgi:very-short-patch-repair endonuclease